MFLPWNHWYHCMCSTYGTWLPGDPRGFRTRHHRQHVEGDYKSPPPEGKYNQLLLRSQRLMKRPRVILTQSQTTLALNEIMDSLQRYEINIVVASLDVHHLHILARFTDRDPRHWMGVAKKDASLRLLSLNQGVKGGIWSVRRKCLPIENRRHQVAVARYILNHGKNGAQVRSFISRSD